MYLVYIATSPCGKVYVGATSRSLEARKAEHKRAALVEQRRSKFYDAIRRFGFDAFRWHIAHYCGSVAEMFAKETYTIQRHDSYRNGLNSTQGGDGTIRGRSPLQIVRLSKNEAYRKRHFRRSPTP